MARVAFVALVAALAVATAAGAALGESHRSAPQYSLPWLMFVDVMAVSPLEEQWTAFKAEHGKTYATEAEHAARRAIFATNLVSDRAGPCVVRYF